MWNVNHIKLMIFAVFRPETEPFINIFFGDTDAISGTEPPDGFVVIG